MLQIYLADLANELYEIDNKSIPIGVGLVGAYCKEKFGDQVALKVFRTFEPFWESVLESPPDIVGFGSYDWNSNLSLAAAKKVKEVNPNCMIVLGGANVEINPNDNKVYLGNNPQIDFLVYGDGEYPFSNLVELYMQHKQSANPGDIVDSIKEAPLDGVRTLLKDELVMGESLDLVTDMDQVPSPYLTGLFDELLENHALMPILQNTRGCPYLCKFCVSGAQSGKIRHFSYERVTAEIDYLRAKAKNRFLRLSDDNFGIIEPDFEVAKYIRKCYDNFNYPVGLKAYSAKKLTERTRQLSIVMKPLMPMIISFQTITPEALKKTKRFSATVDDAASNLAFAREHGIATGTELIFGLPGDTLKTFKDVINTVHELHFDSVSHGSLWLLRGTDFYRPEYRREHGYKTKFMLGENAITVGKDFFSIEADESVVSSNYFTYEEWQRYLQYQFILEISLLFGYARELFYHALNVEIKTTDLLDELLNHPEAYPAFAEMATGYVKKYTDSMFDSKKELIDYLKSIENQWRSNREKLVSLNRVRGLFAVIVKYLFDDPENRFLSEITAAVKNLYKGENPKMFNEVCDLLMSFSQKMVVNPREDFINKKIFQSNYDILAWVRDGYRNPLSGYKLDDAQNFLIQSRNPEALRDIFSKDKKDPRKDCFYFFRYLNPSLIRRTVTERLDIDSPVPLE